MIIWLLLLASVFSLILLVYCPGRYKRRGAEDNIVETAQAALLFISSAIFLRISAVLTHVSIHPKVVIVASLALTLALFWAGMEEISWFQRVLDIKTPQILSGNKQGELNLHNFATGFFHESYFFGAFRLFIFLPFLKSKTSILEAQFFLFFLPSRFLILAGALFVVYDFFADPYFSNPFPQYTYFITLFIFLYYAWDLHPVVKTLLLPTLLGYYPIGADHILELCI